MLSIPIYRARKLYSKEYVIGYYCDETKYYEKNTHSIYDEYVERTKIDPSTLSIHFQDMIASDSDRLMPNGEKDLRIFASLNDDGKGGDIINKTGIGRFGTINEDATVIFSRGNIYLKYEDDKELLSNLIFRNQNAIYLNLKIIGIQQ